MSKLQAVEMTLKRRERGATKEKTYTLLADHNAIRAFEKATGLSLSSLADPAVAYTMTAQTGLLFGLLRKHHGNEFRNEDAVGDLLSNHLDAGGTAEAVASAVTAAMESSHFWAKPKADDDEAAEPEGGKAEPTEGEPAGA